jgi:hypothetical protein
MAALRRRAHAAWKDTVGDEGTFIPVSRRWFTRSRSRGRSSMGTLKYRPPSRCVLICSRRVFLVTVHDPICTEFGNLADALYAFLPTNPVQRSICRTRTVRIRQARSPWCYHSQKRTYRDQPWPRAGPNQSHEQRGSTGPGKCARLTLLHAM